MLSDCQERLAVDGIACPNPSRPTHGGTGRLRNHEILAGCTFRVSTFGSDRYRTAAEVSSSVLESG